MDGAENQLVTIDGVYVPYLLPTLMALFNGPEILLVTIDDTIFYNYNIVLKFQIYKSKARSHTINFY